MKRHHLIALVFLLVLTGCAGVRVGPSETVMIRGKSLTVDGQGGFDPGTVRKPDPHNPNVFVDTDGIVVDQEPIRPKFAVGGTVYIAWALDANSGYTFPDDSAIQTVKVDGSNPPDNFGCARGKPKKVITCSYDKPNGARKFKYSIRVVDKDGKEVETLDPWVHQP